MSFSRQVRHSRLQPVCRAFIVLRRFAILLLLPDLFFGCAHDRANVEKNLMAKQGGAHHVLKVEDAYRVHCPDVVVVRVPHRPDLYWRAAVDVDGSLPIPALGYPRVEGRTVNEIAQHAAIYLGLHPANVVVEVAEYKSKQVYLLGQVEGESRSVAYRGPETVLDLLQRVGGITPGAEPDEVFVIRSHVAEDKRPEVFHVDLRAIVLNKDDSTNLRLQPFDQVHVGETRQALIERCIPRWMRPVHWAIWDTRPDDRPPLTKLSQRLSQVRDKLTAP